MKSIFVSSTFRDMHYERDILHREIRPRLNRLLSGYNRTLRISDLRWGIDTENLSEDDASALVLSVCFNEIDRCRPYMIVLLGDRYGCIPAGKDKSVTHMEILYGAMDHTDPRRVFIYFRNADYSGIPAELMPAFMETDPHCAAQLAMLKEQLRREMPESCREYSSRWSPEEQRLISDTFEQLVYADLAAAFEAEYSNCRYDSPLQKQLAGNEDILSENIAAAYRNDAMLRSHADIAQQSKKPFGLIGEAGVGKSVYMSLLCSALRQRGYAANILFCGDNPFSASVRNAAEFVLYSMLSASGDTYDFRRYADCEYDELLTLLTQAREQVSGQVFVLLDAVDKCEEGMVRFILWVSRYLSDHIRIVFSSRQTAEISNNDRSFNLTQMQYLPEDYAQMLGRILTNHCKALPPAVKHQILGRIDSPLKLSILLSHLLAINSDDYEKIGLDGGGSKAINLHLREVVDSIPGDTTEMICYYMISLLEQSPYADFSLLMLTALSFSEYGLPEEDLPELMEQFNTGWTQLAYLDFLSRFAFFVRFRDNGRLDISHDTIRNALRDAMKVSRDACCERLCSFYGHKAPPDPHSIRTFFTAAFDGRQHEALVEYISANWKLFSVRTAEQMMLASEFRKCIVEMFRKDDGKFYLTAVLCSKDPVTLIQLHGALTSALTGISYYAGPEDVLKIAKALMLIPLSTDLFNADMTDMLLHSCEKMLERNSATGEAVEGFLTDCRSAIDRKRANDPVQAEAPSPADPLEHLLGIACDHTRTYAERLTAISRVSSAARKLALDSATATQAESMLLRLLESGLQELETEVLDVLLADLYTSLGCVYKSMQKWQQALEYDRMSLDIYERMYAQTPHPDIYRKYRERVYNVANVLESWAMKTDAPDLWQQTCEAYKTCYELDIVAMGEGVATREVFQCAETIMSYGSSLIRTGRTDAGIAKYNEGMSVIQELCANNPCAELYFYLCRHMMECTYSLICAGMFREASFFADRNIGAFSKLLEEGEQVYSSQLYQTIPSFSNSVNDVMAQLFQDQDIDHALILSGILCSFYCAVLPGAPAGIRWNTILTQRNIGDIYFLRKQDYARAYEEYQKLFRLIRTFDLMAPDEKGTFNEQVNLRAGDPYYRMYICLFRLGRREEWMALFEGAEEWSRYLASHTHQFRNDPARILYITAMKLMEENTGLGGYALMKALRLTGGPEYQDGKNLATVMQIMLALSGFAEDGNDVPPPESAEN